MVRQASVLVVALLVLSAASPAGLTSQGPLRARHPIPASAHLGTQSFTEREIARLSGTPHPLQNPAPSGRPSFLGAAIAATLGGAAGAHLGASTQSLGAVALGAWLGGAIGLTIVTNDPMASLVGSAGGVAAVLLVASASNELQVYASYALVSALIARSATR